MQITLLYQKFLNCTGVSTDTRAVQRGNLFFALKGGNFNGNEFALEAIAKGASFAVVDEAAYANHAQCVLVPNALEALQQLARHHRRQFNIPVVGITGSNGKTTTKELCHAVISAKYSTWATKGNFNNHIGVPLTLLAMPAHTQVAIIEMGDNKLGDIDELCRIAEPTHGFVTNVGKDHIEGFGSFEGNIRAKSELYQYLRETGGTAFFNAQDPILSNMAKRFAKPLFYGAEGSYSHLHYGGTNPFINYTGESGQLVETQLVGRHNFENIQAAYCLGKHLEVPAEAMHKAIAQYSPQNNRSQIVRAGSLLIVLDAYNANPSSMQAAVDMLEEMPQAEKCAILGDMLELGSISDAEHEEMVKYVANKGFAETIFCGTAFGKHRHLAPKAQFFAHRDEVKAYLQKHAPTSGAVLLKGSRGIKLEELLPYLQ